MKAEKYSQKIKKLSRKRESLLYTQSRYELRPMGQRIMNRYKAMATAEKITRKLVQIQKIQRTAIWVASCPPPPYAQNPSCLAPLPSRVSCHTSSSEWLNCDLGTIAFAASISERLPTNQKQAVVVERIPSSYEPVASLREVAAPKPMLSTTHSKPIQSTSCKPQTISLNPQPRLQAESSAILNNIEINSNSSASFNREYSETVCGCAPRYTWEIIPTESREMFSSLRRTTCLSKFIFTDVIYSKILHCVRVALETVCNKKSENNQIINAPANLFTDKPMINVILQHTENCYIKKTFSSYLT